VAKDQLAGNAGHREVWIIRMSAAGGRPLGVLYHSLVSSVGPDGDLAGDASGQNWILLAGDKFGWIDAGHLVPLAPAPGFVSSCSGNSCEMHPTGPQPMHPSW